jgi:hypothetical protein
VVARVNCSEQTLSDHQCHFFKTLASNSGIYVPTLFSNSFLKSINGIALYSKVFEIIFKDPFEFSQPRVFAPLQNFPKALLLINKPLLQGF